MENLEKLVRQFYIDIDHQDWENAMSLYDENVFYERVEPQKTFTISGINELADFYRSVRNISGSHTVQKVAESNERVVVEGFFVGKKQANSIKLQYVDEFEFNNSQKVVKRKSVIEVV